MFRIRRTLAALLALVFTAAALSGCGDGGGGGGRYGNLSAQGVPNLSDPDYVRTPPPLQLAAFVGDDVRTAEVDGTTVKVDYTNLDSGGYLAVQVNASVEIVAAIQPGGSSSMNYLLTTDGSTNIIPFTMGNGSYSVDILEAVGDTGQYMIVYQDTIQLSLQDELAPFRLQNNIVNYDGSSKAVQFSYELVQNCSTDLEVAQVIFRWICDNVVYDQDKAARVGGSQMMYNTPVIDQVYSQKSGICYDYAALGAAMLRANGIPTRVINGSASDGDGGMIPSHAWNEIWLADEGWISIELAVNPSDYTRVDMTFAAGSANKTINQFIGDGSNYYDSYYN